MYDSSIQHVPKMGYTINGTVPNRGQLMRAMETVKRASVESGVNLATISKTIGKNRGYVNAIITRDSEPRIDTLVRLLNACNYGVYVIEKQHAPIDAMEITVDE